MTQVDVVDHYLCLSVDVQSYGASNDVRQSEIQDELLGVLDEAGIRSGVFRARWIRQAKGDEELSLIPAGVPLHRVVGDFCLGLAAALDRRNQGRERPQRLRLRLAMDDGPVQPAANGFAGRAVVGVSRLVNSHVIRQALSLAKDADLVVILADGVYRDWVCSGRCSVAPHWFRRVPVSEKEFCEDAWLWVPGGDVHRLTLGTEPVQAQPYPWAAGLPWLGAHVTGREAELARAVAALRSAGPTGASAICAISGMPGVGKTTLAVCAAHQMVGDYPDGCVFIDLHGYSADGPPDPPAEVLDRLLRRFAVPGDQIPAHLDDRTSLLRQRLAGRRVLFVLDNAFDLTQVLPLLPSVPGCGVLITSRIRLKALDEAELVTLNVLSGEEGAALFHSIAGRLSSGEPDLVDRVVTYCGRLPLAIRIAAAQYRNDPQCDLAELCERLDDEHGRLAELDDGDRSVAVSFAVSVASLRPHHQRMLAVLAEHPGTEFGLHAASALAGMTMAQSRRLLNGLVDRHLLERLTRERYRFHDLVATFNRGYVMSSHTTPSPALTRSRLVDYYLGVAECADIAITPHRYRIPLEIAHHPPATPDLSRPDDALAWLTTEEHTLAAVCQIAAGQGLDAQCWRLAYTLRGYFFLTKRWDPWTRTHETALAAARRLPDRRGEAMTLNGLGLAAIEQRRMEDAAARYRAALTLFEELGDPPGVYTTRVNLAWIHFYLGRNDQFLAEMNRALTFYEQTGSTRNAAITVRGIALGEIEAGEITQAITHLREAEAAFAQLGFDVDLAMTLNALGEAHARSGAAAAAENYHQRALDVSRRCGSAYEGARANHRLGDIQAGRGNEQAARDHWRRAGAAYLTLGVPQAAVMQGRLGGIHLRRRV